jgi:plasmid maintenance system antidote protein VapI
MGIHIGEIIQVEVEKRGINKSALARSLSMTSTNLHKIFKRESIDTGLLERLSNSIGYDFFQHYRMGNTDKEKAMIVAEPEMLYLRKQLESIKALLEHQQEDQARKTG